MKLNWTIILCGVVLVAAAFSLAVMEGADAAARDAAHDAPRIAQGQ